jgi:hypothetical protein
MGRCDGCPDAHRILEGMAIRTRGRSIVWRSDVCLPGVAMTDAGGQKPTKNMLVAWALGECGGDREFVDRLDVAMLAFRNYPAYFGFQKYPEHPDVGAVRSQLYGLLIAGNSHLFGLKTEDSIAIKEREGNSSRFRLSPAGIAWWKTNRDWIRLWIDRNARSELGTTKSPSGRVSTEDDAKVALASRVRGTPGFSAWLRNRSAPRREIGIQTFFTCFGIGPRTPRPEYLEARDRLLEATAHDGDVTSFLTFLDGAFGEEYKKILSGDVQI